MAGELDYLLRVAVADMASFVRFYKRLIALAPMKTVSSRFVMERMKHTTAYPLAGAVFRDRQAEAADGDSSQHNADRKSISRAVIQSMK